MPIFRKHNVVASSLYRAEKESRNNEPLTKRCLKVKNRPEEELKKALQLVICLTTLLCVGCAATPAGFSRACKACNSHSGLKYYYVFPWEQIHCQDGSVIKQ